MGALDTTTRVLYLGPWSVLEEVDERGFMTVTARMGGNGLTWTLTMERHELSLMTVNGGRFFFNYVLWIMFAGMTCQGGGRCGGQCALRWGSCGGREKSWEVKWAWRVEHLIASECACELSMLIV